MYISYFDETGDDGFPKYSSELFVLTSVYLHHQNWKDIYSRLFAFKKFLKDNYELPIKTEIHTKKLLLNKNPYKYLSWSEVQRLEILNQFAACIARLDIKSINVIIDKKKINAANPGVYKNILDRALSFNVQRIENDIKRTDPTSKFIILTDEGRVSSMRKTTRRIQKINFIPSKYTTTSYQQNIGLLIEDPLPKDSKESYLIQVADFISYFVFLKHLNKNSWHNRLQWLNIQDVDRIINTLTPILNTATSGGNAYGFVCYPK